MSTISLNLAKPGKAMPGPYSSLMVLRRRASRSGPGRAVRGRKTKRRRRSDSTFKIVHGCPRPTVSAGRTVTAANPVVSSI